MNGRANLSASFLGNTKEAKILFQLFHKRKRKETVQTLLMKLLLPSYQNQIKIQQKKKVLNNLPDEQMQKFSVTYLSAAFKNT